MLSFDALIATYNRPEKVASLVRTLIKCNPAFTKIIVVDSSDNDNTSLKELKEVHYVRSNHKNQPYQRYLGYLISESDILVYFDDDMEILDSSFLNIFEKEFKNENVVGLQAKMRNKHDDATIRIKPSVFNKIWSVNNTLVNLLRWVTMYPRLRSGKFWYCGLRGEKPDNEQCSLEWVNGWVFAARRDKLFMNFNFQLLDIFEKRIGMGEDLLIGHLLSKAGTVKFIPILLFEHNDQRSSTYTADHYSYGRRTAFSRYFLSMEYARINSESFLKAKLIFWYYSICRLMGMLINILIQPDRNTLSLLKGSLSGIWLAGSYKYFMLDESRWIKEIKRNFSNSKI